MLTPTRTFHIEFDLVFTDPTEAPFDDAAKVELWHDLYDTFVGGATTAHLSNVTAEEITNDH